LPKKKLQDYADGNNLFNVLEHPYTVDPTKKQLERIQTLNEFMTSYKILKLQEMDHKVTISSSSTAGEYFLAILGGVKHQEKFLAAFLDSGNTIIETRVISEGTIGESPIYPREVVKYALNCDCKSIIFAHNHPGGSQKPSGKDIEVTKNFISVFKSLNINVHDHMIIANNAYISMAEQGYLPIRLSQNEKAISEVYFENEYVFPELKKGDEEEETGIGDMLEWEL
jgi:DNA repair protein RadC